MAAPDQSLATLTDLPKSIEVDMRSQVNKFATGAAAQKVFILL